jgi:catechol 2,3-dioxygenase-like lactoylglutathione lyase family enzyme
MRLAHIALPVRDRQRSLEFYQAHFGFDKATAQWFPDGTVIVRDADRFDLALHPGEPPDPMPDFWHFGFSMPGPEQVRQALARIEVAGVPVVERYDEAEHVSFKCLDPDGWRVEVYWDA